MSDITSELVSRFDPALINTPDKLWSWIRSETGLIIPRTPRCCDHAAPFEYIHTAYTEPAQDLIVWAPRGGGKTRLAALATLLDLLFKPGVAVRVLGGSKDQSMRMWEHLAPDLEKFVGDGFRMSRNGWARLQTGSNAAAIPQSERAVRGLRIQKLRCDEVELFNPAIFEAAKFTTRSATDQHGKRVTGVIECLSTLHQPWGLMHRVIEDAQATGKKIIKWCILDVLENCPPERDCNTCPLHPECQGRAKNGDGYVSIDDAIRMKERSSEEAWNAEMLCNRPSVRGAVFPTFDKDVHVVEKEPDGLFSLGMDFGFNDPFVCLWIADDGTNVFVFDELVQTQQTLEFNLKMVNARKWGRGLPVACDPAGNARSDQTGDSNTQVLKAHGHKVATNGSLILNGLEQIRTGLRTGAGTTTLTIHPRCQQLIRAMQSYHYDPARPGESPVKDGADHLIDALRYFYINRTKQKQQALTGGNRY